MEPFGVPWGVAFGIWRGGDREVRSQQCLMVVSNRIGDGGGISVVEPVKKLARLRLTQMGVYVFVGPAEQVQI